MYFSLALCRVLPYIWLCYVLIYKAIYKKQNKTQAKNKTKNKNSVQKYWPAILFSENRKNKNTHDYWVKSGYVNKVEHFSSKVPDKFVNIWYSSALFEDNYTLSTWFNGACILMSGKWRQTFEKKCIYFLANAPPKCKIKMLRLRLHLPMRVTKLELFGT